MTLIPLRISDTFSAPALCEPWSQHSLSTEIFCKQLNHSFWISLDQVSRPRKQPGSWPEYDNMNDFRLVSDRLLVLFLWNLSSIILSVSPTAFWSSRCPPKGLPYYTVLEHHCNIGSVSFEEILCRRDYRLLLGCFVQERFPNLAGVSFLATGAFETSGRQTFTISSGIMKKEMAQPLSHSYLKGSNALSILILLSHFRASILALSLCFLSVHQSPGGTIAVLWLIQGLFVPIILSYCLS